MKNIKILLADDNEDDLLFFHHALNDSGIGADLTAISENPACGRSESRKDFQT